MTRTRLDGRAVGATLLLLAGCDSKTPNSHDQSVAKVEQYADLALAQKLGGSTWVPKDAPPSGSVEDNCTTDAGLTLEQGGDYAGLYESGSWTVKDRRLIVTVRQSNDDTGGEGLQRPLNPPQIHRWEVDSVERDVATLHDRGLKFWMFRCS